MAWIFPKIEMELLKWICLILCFDFIYADVTQQPQELILHRKSLIFIKNRHFWEISRHFLRNFHDRKRRIEGHFVDSSVCLGDVVRLAL